MRLQPVEVLLGVVQAVRVVDPQPVGLARRQPPQQLAVHRPEHVLPLGAHRRQVVHVEEPAVVDLVGRHPPEAHPVRLGFEQFVRCPNGEVVDLDGLEVTILAETAPSDGPIGDSALLVSDGTGRVLALEVLTNTSAVANVIRENKTYLLPGIIQTGKKQGMRLMDDTLIDLYERDLISAEEVYARADQKHVMRQHLKI